jgi:hypothetical protein
LPSALGVVAALLTCFCGMAWLAIALPTHWQQVRGAARPASSVRMLRLAGATALLVSLLTSLGVEHPSMAALVWVMSLSASAWAVALTLAWRPRWLAWLVAWI